MPKKATLTRKEIRERWQAKNPDYQMNWYYQKRFGITLGQYRQMWNDQKGLCAICYKPETMSNRSLAVDHDHKTGRVRALLCGGCNVSLGRVEDDPAILQRMIDYLITYRAEDVTEDRESQENDY